MNNSAGFFDWGLNLPSKGIARRVARTFHVRGKETLADLPGPGCIRHFWVTGRRIGRELVLRIFFDDESTPRVEAPLADFFGVMHNLSESNRDGNNPDREPYPINTPFLASKPHNGFSCYFPMPFSRSAKLVIENETDESSRLYYIVDWHAYPGQTLAEPMRFCASWRRESPTRDYQDDFLVLDADGPGRLIGFVHSIDMLHDRHSMRWSHAGSDNIHLDGNTRHPAFLRGIGGEDAFGTSYGGHCYPPGSALFADMPYYIQKNPADDDRQKLVGYRFFAHDAICFDRSIHFRFGARAHDLATTVYWYSSAPVRPFVRIPPYQERLPGQRHGRNHDLPLRNTGSWFVTGPFPDGFPHAPPTAVPFDVNLPFHGRLWRHHPAKAGFVVFNHVFRPCPSNQNSQTLVNTLAMARSRIHVSRATAATFTFGWDDRLLFKLNDGPPVDLGLNPMFESKSVQVKLKAGQNELALSLSNSTGLSAGGWCFSFGAVTADGIELLPKAETDPPKDQGGAFLAMAFGAGDSPIPKGWLGFLPPYSENSTGRELGTSLDLTCSPQSHFFSTRAGLVKATIETSDNTTLGFRCREEPRHGSFRDQSALIRSEVRANPHPGGEPVVLRLTLEGLPGGTWDLTSFHHCHSDDETASPLRATVNDQAIVDSLSPQTAGLNPEKISRLRFQVKVRKGEPVTIVYEAKGAVVMNGMEIVPSAKKERGSTEPGASIPTIHPH